MTGQSSFKSRDSPASYHFCSKHSLRWTRSRSIAQCHSSSKCIKIPILNSLLLVLVRKRLRPARPSNSPSRLPLPRVGDEMWASKQVMNLVASIRCLAGRRSLQLEGSPQRKSFFYFFTEISSCSSSNRTNSKFSIRCFYFYRENRNF